MRKRNNGHPFPIHFTSVWNGCPKIDIPAPNRVLQSSKVVPSAPPDQMLPRNCGAFFMPVSKGAKRTLRTFTSGAKGTDEGKARNDALQYNNSWFLIHLFKHIFSGSINKISKKYKKNCASQNLRIYLQGITCAL